MKRRLRAAALLVLVPAVATAQTPDSLRARYDSAAYAWRAGDYPAALETLERLLAAPGGARLLEPAALLTGELYRTDSVAADGREVRWSPDGRYAAYATGNGAERKTHIVAMGQGRKPAASVAGYGLVFAPGGNEAAYLGVAETPELAAARAELERLMAAEDFAGFQKQRAELARLESERATIRVRDLRNGREREVQAPGLTKQTLAWAADGRTLYLAGGPTAEPARADIYALASLTRSAAPKLIAERTGGLSNLAAVPGGRYLVYNEGRRVAVHDLTTGEARSFNGAAYAVAPDGSALAFVHRDSAPNAPQYALMRLALAPGADPVALLQSDRPMANPAISPDGARIVFQMMPREDWELYVVASDGTGERRLTREIQHDLFPRFAGPDRVIAAMGEGRHRRSYLYDLRDGSRTRLFHNNTVRTVAPEYEWAVSPDATKLLVVAERDGDTISPERGVYVMDLARKVTLPELQARVRASLAAERDLRARGQRTFAPIEARVRAVTDAVSVERIYDAENDLYRFGSKYITQPGNRRAIEYLSARLREFGYEPELQEFEPEPGVRTANVIARLAGATNPELVYVISSHFDSVEEGPGSDDNTSGTTALLEAARVLAGTPQAATIEFAFFTGEEAGLYGSREYVRRAVADGKRLVGALNNDMIGFANDERLDNTIRYSNDGIRDLQHAAAFLFTDLITYDARYYKNTDAHAYYEQYGDIVGGIGSYPILGNPHYHQPHDVLETINHRLVGEVSKTTIATIMALASSPSRLTGLEVAAGTGGAAATWTPAVEGGVTGYVVAYGPAAEPMRHRLTVTEPRATLPNAGPGTRVAVKALGRDGMEGWDWARAELR